ncbi:MAG: thiamine diphosphokinase [Candidatus Zixiibacteriota bacterium]
MIYPSRHIIFLNSRYSASENKFYLRLLRGGYKIAVDGGIRFFRKNKLTPDLLIGDFDSAPKMSRKYLSRFEVIRHPSRKDKTDSQLAVELSLERGAKTIDICGGIAHTEIDHTLGNIFLLDLVNKWNRRNKLDVAARLISSCNMVYLFQDQSTVLNARRGDFLSIIPLSDGVRIEYSGLEYPVPEKPLTTGDSLTLRNYFKSSRCHLKISGRAVVTIISK